eukprot:COSAG03_NODE_12219_length_556_cov_2.586433_2_plen_76_part_01
MVLSRTKVKKSFFEYGLYWFQSGTRLPLTPRPTPSNYTLPSLAARRPRPSLEHWIKSWVVRRMLWHNWHNLRKKHN